MKKRNLKILKIFLIIVLVLVVLYVAFRIVKNKPLFSPEDTSVSPEASVPEATTSPLQHPCGESYTQNGVKKMGTECKEDAPYCLRTTSPYNSDGTLQGCSSTDIPPASCSCYSSPSGSIN